MRKPVVAILASVLPSAALWWGPALPGLPTAGQRALALTLAAVCWWVGGVTASAYTALLLMVAYIVTGVAPPAEVLSAFATPPVWLIFAAFLLAAAVEKSGLGRRAAYALLARWAISYPAAVALAFLLGAALSLLIPLPFPRTLLIMGLYAPLLKEAGLPAAESAMVGFAVFMASAPTSALTLTGDSALNVAAVALSGVPATWPQWLALMGVPALAACLLMFGLHLLLFRPHRPFALNRDALAQRRRELGPLSAAEWRALAWVVFALALWVTDRWHGIHPAWVALAAVAGLSLPGVGGLLGPDDIGPRGGWPVVLFAGASITIGTVARSTGLAGWVADAAFAYLAPGGFFAFALAATALTMAVHMFMGSAMSTQAVLIPPLAAYAAARGWPPLLAALLVYAAVSLHFLLPYQQLGILVGAGPVGGYGARETLRFGLPMTLLMLLLGGLIMPGWWRLLGLV